jgi:hypothetical protein
MKEDTHMADLPPYRDTGDDTGVAPGTPRWVKIFGIIVLVLVLLVGIIIVTGVGGEHGPGRHTPPSSVIEDYTPPEGRYL